METINIAKILKQKNPRLAKLVPRFVIRGLERLIRVEEINYVLEHFGSLPPMEFIARTLEYIGVTYTVHGGETLDPQGRYIFASNHPLGGLDGLILSLALERFSPNGLKFVVNDILMNLEPLRPIFVPVNKHGRQGCDYVRMHDDMYNGGGQIITFPAGLCSRLIDGLVQDTPWRRTFVQRGERSGRAVVPVFIDGLNSRGFYRLALWRKRLGLKVNVEMLLLPREMFAQRGKHINIYIGESVELDATHGINEWVEELRGRCYSLSPARQHSGNPV